MLRRKGKTPPADLPELWRRAYERDRQGQADHADPAPERAAGRMLAAFIAVGLFFLAFPGTLLGVWNLVTIAASHNPARAAASWIQLHGHAQVFGWVGSFMLGISLYVLPKFRQRSLHRFLRPWLCWVLWTVGVSWRWLGTFYNWHWRVALVGSAICLLGAYGMLQWVLFSPGPARRQSKELPIDLGSWLGIVGFFVLGIVLVWNLILSVAVAHTGASPAVPPVADRSFWLVALWGFVVPVAWGYSTRFVTVFLGLPAPRQSATAWLCLGVLAFVGLVIGHRFLAADLLICALVIGAIWALRVFARSERPPKRAEVYWHYPIFVRMAFGWLLVSAGLSLLADRLPEMPGLGGAARHAVTVGFVATLIFSIGPRILPSFLNGRQLASARLMGASLWLLTIGCTLRVVSEALAYGFVGWIWRLLPVSAFVELAAVLLFAANLAWTLASPVPAWFEPSSVRGDLPLYFYLTSFPETRRWFQAAGLKTLERVEQVPRTLTLAEAAAADGVALEPLLAQLREFFQRRQPRRPADTVATRARRPVVHLQEPR